MNEFLQIIFESRHLLIRRPILELSTKYAIFCMFSVEIYYHFVHNGSEIFRGHFLIFLPANCNASC